MIKNSYWSKHKEQTGFSETQKLNLPLISDGHRKIFEDGQVILIDKPLHWTSFDVVRKIRNAIKVKKTGHAGTLDPLATGLLIVCTGKFTKKINEFMAQEKEYTGTFTLGAVTPTYDLESLPEQPKDFSQIASSQIHEAAASLTGNIQQVPPIYSAIKKQGTPLYELARRGEAVEIQPRSISVKSFDVVSTQLPIIAFKVVCSTGTYIRSLANDFGAILGCGAYLSELRRTRIGDFKADNALEPLTFIEQINADKE